jgi:hypothetical protein
MHREKKHGGRKGVARNHRAYRIFERSQLDSAYADTRHSQVPDRSPEFLSGIIERNQNKRAIAERSRKFHKIFLETLEETLRRLGNRWLSTLRFRNHQTIVSTERMLCNSLGEKRRLSCASSRYLPVLKAPITMKKT